MVAAIQSTAHSSYCQINLAILVNTLKKKKDTEQIHWSGLEYDVLLMAKSLTTPLPSHTLLNIRLTWAKKPLTVMRIDGGVKSIGSPAQELLPVPSLLVWERVLFSSLPALNRSALIRRSGQPESSPLIVRVTPHSHSNSCQSSPK